ncbi:putative glycogenin glucosyltransferase [Helianthus annuus]|nr:putative glycogenin glucosyltransferase [Helianthus annuus]
MLRDLDNRRDNPDGADQGFIGGYFPDLLDQPMFIHPLMEPNLMVHRLPLGYQMDASYYYLRLTWSVPCQPNNVITFPGASWLKPWYWWSWPVLPLGIQWHEQRRETIGYSMYIIFNNIIIFVIHVIFNIITTVFGSTFFIRDRYDSEMPFVLIQTIIYLCIIAVTHLARPTTKLCYRGTDKNLTIIHTSLKAIAVLSIIISYMPISRDC